LAALDSTRLQRELAKHFGLSQDEVTGCRTYGGHGEQMAVFAGTARVAGVPLRTLIGTERLPREAWQAIQQRVRQGGRRIIELRGRSSFQSPAHHAVMMVRATLDGRGYPWPSGCYVHDRDAGFEHIMMAMETRIDQEGIRWTMPQGTEQEQAALRASYQHVVQLRDEVVSLGLLPPPERWPEASPQL
jgi:malate dehydrogenase